MKRANCLGQAPNKRTDPDARDPFFPGKGESLNVGKILCFTCEVRAECVDYKERTGSKHGMWGGMMPKRDKDEDEVEEDE